MKLENRAQDNLWPFDFGLYKIVGLCAEKPAEWETIKAMVTTFRSKITTQGTAPR